MRDFNKWLDSFKDCISDYDYYVNFNKIIKNVDNIKVELNILNSLIGSKDIEKDFEKIIIKYPETLKCIPILLAVRQKEVYAIDIDGEFIYNFNSFNQGIEQYKIFMRKTGLFRLIEKHIISNLIDYVTGVETGLDSNARKNRGGHLMEDLVEQYIRETGVEYYKEMRRTEIEKKFGFNLSNISNDKKTEKRFDFVVVLGNMVYAIETNFYSSSGSKLNETARSYKNLALESKEIDNFIFVWFTDGKGWYNAKHNLEEAFDNMEHIYNINDLKNGILNKLFESKDDGKKQMATR